MSVDFLDVVPLALLVGFLLVFEGFDLHVVEGEGEVEVDEVERREELLTLCTLDDLDGELLADNVEDAPALDF
jgi:hypothetical protein